MDYTLTERFKLWLCHMFGHRAFIDYNSSCGSAPEICRRCNRLLSTAFSREVARFAIELAKDPTP